LVRRLSSGGRVVGIRWHFAALTFAPGLVLAFYRLWVGTVVFVVILVATRRRLSWSLLKATWLGGVLLAGDMAMFYSAVKTTSIVDVTVIGASTALVMVVSRRLSRRGSLAATSHGSSWHGRRGDRRHRSRGDEPSRGRR